MGYGPWGHKESETTEQLSPILQKKKKKNSQLRKYSCALPISQASCSQGGFVACGQWSISQRDSMQLLLLLQPWLLRKLFPKVQLQDDGTSIILGAGLLHGAELCLRPHVMCSVSEK